jgi:hypothetical protein
MFAAYFKILIYKTRWKMASFKTKTSCTGILYGRLLVQIILLHLLIFNCVGSYNRGDNTKRQS